MKTWQVIAYGICIAISLAMIGTALSNVMTPVNGSEPESPVVMTLHAGDLLYSTDLHKYYVHGFDVHDNRVYLIIGHYYERIVYQGGSGGAANIYIIIDSFTTDPVQQFHLRGIIFDIIALDYMEGWITLERLD